MTVNGLSKLTFVSPLKEFPDPEERIEMIKLSTANLGNVVVSAYDGLVVNYCKENKINVIIRGMRNYSDYENLVKKFSQKV